MNDVEISREEISSYISDNKLICFDELFKLVNKNDNYKTDKTSIYKKHIDDDLIIVSDRIYLYCDKLKIYFKSSMPINNFLNIYLLILKEKSHKKLTEQERKIITISKVSEYETEKDIRLLENFMKKPDNCFKNPKLDEIHFMNGYIKLSDMNRFLKIIHRYHNRISICNISLNDDFRLQTDLIHIFSF